MSVFTVGDQNAPAEPEKAAVDDVVERTVRFVMAHKPPGIDDEPFLRAVLVRLKSFRKTKLSVPVRERERPGKGEAGVHNVGGEEPEKLPQKSEAFVRALERGKLARSVLEEEEGGSRSSEQISELLGISRQAVDQRRRSRRLVAWQDAAGHWRFPIWQFDPAIARPHPGLGSILEALPGDPWSDMIFFLSKDDTLGTRPLDLLRSGKAKRAVLAALRYNGRGA